MSSRAQADSDDVPECWSIRVPIGVPGCGATPGPGLTSAFPLPPDYSIRHIGQFFRSNYIFLFQLPWLPEKLLSMSDFQVQ